MKKILFVVIYSKLFPIFRNIKILVVSLIILEILMIVFDCSISAVQCRLRVLVVVAVVVVGKKFKIEA